MRFLATLSTGVLLSATLPALAGGSAAEVVIDNIMPCVAVGQRIVFSGASVQSDSPIAIGMTLTFVDSMNADLRYIGVVRGSVRQNNHATGRWTAELTALAQ